ncbi:MAG: hypothetical protein QXE46_04210 [Candidatus Thermoplasmatota archaeon]
MDWKETDRRLIEIGKEMVEGAYSALKVDEKKLEEELEEMNKGKKEHNIKYLIL